MRIEGIRTIQGPNIYSHQPVLAMELHLEDLDGRESREFPGFNERLLALLPGLKEHHCGLERPGGFVERLDGGTFFGHIVEHVALELSNHAGISVNMGKTRAAGEHGLYKVVVAYKAEQGMRHLLRVAVELVEALLQDATYALAERLEEARSIVAETELGPSTRAIVEAAERRGIPWLRIGEGSLVQLGYGKHRKRIEAAMSEQTSIIAVEIADDKRLTKNVLAQAAIPVPRGSVARSQKEAVAASAEIGGPVVVKPADSCQGKGVSLNLTSVEEIERAFQCASRYSRRVIVEEMLAGQDYRVLVVNGKVVAACERQPPCVTGDGQRTIAQLLAEVNSDPRRGEGHEKPLTKIKADEIVAAYLRRQGVRFDSIPPAGQKVFLREGANLSTGGTARDVTELLHPQVRSLCERAARVIGLDICGVDLIAANIAAPIARGNGGIVEVNAAPGLRMHHHPSEGQARDAGATIIEMMFPADAPSRIPIISITGTNGKTTVTRMIGHAFAEAGLRVGMTTTDGIYIGGERVVEGDTTGPHSARVVLCDPAVEVAVLETARGGIARRGLGYDWSDAAVLTNIAPDHLGQDGIESLEDLVHIKSLLAERVRSGGTLVLNADDEHLARLMEEPRVNRVPKRVVYFSLRENHLLLRRHLDAGGTVFFLKNGWIIEAEGHDETPLAQAAAMPATLGGVAEFNIANALAAAAACRAQGLSREEVAIALLSFRCDAHNPGRGNLFRVGDGYVVLDYGHNPAAFASISRMVSQWDGKRITGVVGVPGDRNDELIQEAGRVAARSFHRLIIREDKDRRGRPVGEVAGLLCRAAHEVAPEREVQVVMDECEALARALREIDADDVVVVFYEKLAPVLEMLKKHGAAQVATIDLPRPQWNIAGM